MRNHRGVAALTVRPTPPDHQRGLPWPEVDLVFRYDRELVELVRGADYARWDPGRRVWSATWSAGTVRVLDRLRDRGVQVTVTGGPGTPVGRVADGVLREGTGRNRWWVIPRGGDSFGMFQQVPGARWDRQHRVFRCGAASVPTLADMAARGVLVDPGGILADGDGHRAGAGDGSAPGPDGGVVVSFDMRTGRFRVRGDPGAARVFQQWWPERDVVGCWRQRGLPVRFSDRFSELVYAGEVARQGPGLWPDRLKLRLTDYQAVAVAVAVARGPLGLAVLDEPGLGKTLVAIATGVHLLDTGAIDRVLAVVPTTLITQWCREIERAVDPVPEIVAVTGDPARRAERWEQARRPGVWVVVGYDVLHRDRARTPGIGEGALVVFDEAHRVKNPRAKRTREARRIATEAAVTLALTGTPVENRPDEWHAVISGLAVPGALGDITGFRARYMYPDRWGGASGARNLDELARRSAPHIIRRTKQQVARWLPPLRTQHLTLDVPDAYREVLVALHRDAATLIAERVRGSRRNRDTDGVLPGLADDGLRETSEMTAVSMLRMLCASPRLLHLSDSPSARALTASGSVPDVDGPKLDELRELVGGWRTAGQRVVVFTGFARLARLVAERLTDDGARVELYLGDMSAAERDRAVSRFRDPDSGVDVLVSTDAGSEGLNLADACSVLVNLDIPWTPGRLTQRYNRIHRMDVRSGALAVNLTLAGTVEDGVVRMVESKARLAGTLMGDPVRGPAVGRRRTREDTDWWADLARVLSEAAGVSPDGDSGSAGGRHRSPGGRRRSADRGTAAGTPMLSDGSREGAEPSRTTRRNDDGS